MHQTYFHEPNDSQEYDETDSEWPVNTFEEMTIAEEINDYPPLIDTLNNIFPQHIKLTYITNHNVLSLYALPTAVPQLIEHFYFHPQLSINSTQLLDIIITDHPSLTRRFLITYILRSLTPAYTLQIKTICDELTPCISITHLHINANWYEREAWDIFGVRFLFNPNLTRILNDYGFRGYPIRKDFPLSGFFELQYSDTLKLIHKTRLELTQQYRVFTFSTAWQNTTLEIYDDSEEFVPSELDEEMEDLVEISSDED